MICYSSKPQASVGAAEEAQPVGVGDNIPRTLGDEPDYQSEPGEKWSFHVRPVTTRVQELTEKFQELKDSAAVRRLRLADSLLSQSFYDEANELTSWMTEKHAYV